MGLSCEAPRSLGGEAPRSALRPRSEAEWGLWRAAVVFLTATFSPYPYHTTSQCCRAAQLVLPRDIATMRLKGSLTKHTAAKRPSGVCPSRLSKILRSL